MAQFSWLVLHKRPKQTFSLLVTVEARNHNPPRSGGLFVGLTFSPVICVCIHGNVPLGNAWTVDC